MPNPSDPSGLCPRLAAASPDVAAAVRAATRPRVRSVGSLPRTLTAAEILQAEARAPRRDWLGSAYVGAVVFLSAALGVMFAMELMGGAR